ncbi:hypothetical protein ASD76_00050 [Altererythrobacter sp. Root672]|nr:hypothetical protein ASD76_00050 [Altererythrobacter sp. Root672]
MPFRLIAGAVGQGLADVLGVEAESLQGTHDIPALSDALLYAGGNQDNCLVVLVGAAITQKFTQSVIEAVGSGGRCRRGEGSGPD